MKIRVQTAELGRALYRVQGIADKKSSMPILAHVLLQAQIRGDEGALTISATDLDVGISGEYTAEVEQPGSVAVRAKQLYDIVKSLPSATATLESQDNHWIDIHSGQSRFRLVGMSPDQFPALPARDNVETFNIPGDLLGQMIEQTLFCVSTDDNRHNLSGVYCSCPEPRVLRMVATDGHRLALSERRFDTDIPISEGVIVPRKGFHELQRLLAEGDDSTIVQLGFAKNNGVLHVGSAMLSTRLVEGQFPDYTQVIPKSFDKTCKINRQQFLEALKRVSLLSQNRAHGVKLRFADHTLELVAEDPELGEAREALPVEYNGSELLMGFNAKYIVDVLSLIREEAVVIQLTDDLSPGVIRGLENEQFLSVIMPMRI